MRRKGVRKLDKKIDDLREEAEMHDRMPSSLVEN